jgi:porphobilinogen deaminase
LLRELKAGCLAPVAGLATLEGSTLRIDAVVLSVDGLQRLSVQLDTVLEPLTVEHSKLACESAFSEAEALGIQAANALLQSGAAPLIADAH